MKLKKILLLSATSLMSLVGCIDKPQDSSEEVSQDPEVSSVESSGEESLSPLPGSQGPQGLIRNQEMFQGEKENLLNQMTLSTDASWSFDEAILKVGTKYTFAVKFSTSYVQLKHEGFVIEQGQDDYDFHDYSTANGWKYGLFEYTQTMKEHDYRRLFLNYYDEDDMYQDDYGQHILSEPTKNIACAMLYEGEDIPQDSFYHLKGTVDNLVIKGDVYEESENVYNLGNKTNTPYFIACQPSIAKLTFNNSLKPVKKVKGSWEWVSFSTQSRPVGADYTFQSDTKLEKLLVIHRLVLDDADLDIDAMFEKAEDKTGPHLSGSETTYVVNVDDPITAKEIKKQLQAIDDVDGDVSDTITIESDTYTGNEHKVGNYKIVFSAHDRSNNKSTLTVNIQVKDSTKPVITGPDTLSYSYTKKKTQEEILANYTASDNYDHEVSCAISSDTYTENFQTPGNYQIIVKATDTSGNVGTKTVTVKVIDDVAPVITGSQTLTKACNIVLTLEDILKQYKATDVIDGAVELVVEEDNYTGHANAVGSYTIKLSATDHSGNKAEFTITVNVQDTIPPVWYTPKTLIHVQDTINLSTQDVVNVLIKTDELKSDYALCSIESDYVFSDNQLEGRDPVVNKPGLYDVSIHARYFDGNDVTLQRRIEVYESEDPIGDNTSFWTKVKNGLMNFWKTIYNHFFKHIGNFFIKLLNMMGANLPYLENI